MKPVAGHARRAQLEKLAAAMFEKDEQKRALDRADHLYLYNLFGDPSARIDRPAKLPLVEPGTAVAGGALRVSGTAPFDGALTVIVERGRKEGFKPAIKTNDYSYSFVRAFDPA